MHCLKDSLFPRTVALLKAFSHSCSALKLSSFWDARPKIEALITLTNKEACLRGFTLPFCI
jgi:hypothetical protein